jgi:hypothetical protein
MKVNLLAIILIISITLSLVLNLVFVLMQWPIVLFIQKIALYFQPSIFDWQSINLITIQSYNLALSGLKNPGQTLTKNEISHLLDVYQNLKFFYFSLIIVDSLTVILYLLWKNLFNVNVFVWVKKNLLIILVFFLINLLFFNLFFETFHNVLFPQGNWQFSQTSALIQVYPLSFWIIWLIVFCGCLMALYLFISLSLSKKLNGKYGSNQL